MGIQKIQSEDCSVASLFQSFYAVPDYQREYVWDTDQVEQLLKDVREEIGDGPAQDAPDYFIGSIVVCPGRDGVWRDRGHKMARELRERRLRGPSISTRKRRLERRPRSLVLSAIRKSCRGWVTWSLSRSP